MSGNDDISGQLKQEVGDDVLIHDTKDPDEVFLTNKSRLKLALLTYKDGIRARTAWVNPFILLVTTLSILLVADFQQNLGLSSDIWSSIYILISLISLIWLLKELWKWYVFREKARTDTVISQLRK